jgi:hypothetical protein
MNCGKQRLPLLNIHYSKGQDNKTIKSQIKSTDQNIKTINLVPFKSDDNLICVNIKVKYILSMLSRMTLR